LSLFFCVASFSFSSISFFEGGCGFEGKFYVVESNTYKTVLETTDMSILGELKPGETKILNARLNSVYEPIFRWEFEYNGNSYSTFTKYGDK